MNTSTGQQPPKVITTHTSIRGVLGVLGPADALAEAFKTRTPVTLDGKCAGEQVHLGHTKLEYDDGISARTIGLDSERAPHADYPGVPRAVYLIDMEHLDGAPTIKALRDKARGRATRAAMNAEQEALAEQRRTAANMYDND